ncbi:MAG: GAF domain-containing protein [Microcoleaceae cyanobacterium]
MGLNHQPSGFNQNSSTPRLSSQQMQQCLEQFPRAIALLDCQMRYLLTNRRWREALGGSDHTLMGDSGEKKHPILPDNWLDIQQCCLAGQSQTWETMDVQQTGDWQRQLQRDLQGNLQTCCRWEAHPWYGDSGTVEGIILSLETGSWYSSSKSSPLSDQDILAESQLQSSEVLFQQLFERSADAILILEDGIFTDCNQATVAMMGYETKAEFLALHPSCLSPEIQPDGRSSFEKANEMIATARTKGTHRFEWMHQRRDGEDFWVEVLLTVIPLKDKQVLHTVWREIGDRKQAEFILQSRTAQLYKQNQALIQLAKHPAVNQGDLETALQLITTVTARTLNVERASIWLYDPERISIHCQDLFEQTSKQHHQGTRLNISDYPNYFATLAHEDIIAVQDANLDPRTCEFSSSYLQPLGIASMLDSPIRLSGETVGVICLEHIGQVRPWQPEDENFVRSVADLIALAMEACDRQCSEAELQERAVQLRQQNQALIQLAKHPAVNQGKLELAIQTMTEIVAQTLQVERVSVWFYRADKTNLQCEDLYKQATQDHHQGSVLDVIAYPDYFQAIATEEIIAMNDAQTDPRTLEFAEAYLKPLGITSMLDSPIQFGGETIGVICIEHIGKMRCWEPEDEHFVRSVADLITLTLEARDRRETEAELQQKEEQYRSIFEAVSDAILINDLATGQLVEVNPAAHQMHGYRYEEFLQLSPTEFIHPDSLKTFTEYLEVVKAGKPFTCEALDLHKDGYSINIEVRGTRFNYNGKPHGLGIVRDITDRKQAELQLQQKTEALEQTLRELHRTQAQMVQSEKMSGLGQMVAGVAHEINNPVNFIHANLPHAEEYVEDLLSLIELYQEHYPDPTEDLQKTIEKIELDFLKADFIQLLQSMKVGTDRIREIVLSLRNFSRLDESDLKKVNLHEGLDSTLMILRNRFKTQPDQRPEIQLIQDYGNLPLVQCYPGQLNQVFMNILSNSIDALEETWISQTGNHKTGTTPLQIRICTEVIEPNWVRVRIADNGKGMPESVREKLFDPFFTTKPVGKGTGLGLSISYQVMVEKHGGKLECYSTPGLGTEFVIDLPVDPSPP